MGNVTETLADEFARLVAAYRENYGDPSGSEAWNLIADFSVEHAARITTALSVPCLQEPVGYVSNKAIARLQASKIACQAIVAERDELHETPLFAQPIEVREQAIRECKAIVDDWLKVFGEADPQYISAKTFAGDAVRDISDRIGDLLEGR